MSDPAFSLIIPAAGRGKRMKAPMPKPYLKLGGRTVLEHTLSCFMGVTGLTQVIVSTTDEYNDQAQKILDRLFPQIETITVEGGSERQHSIYNALRRVNSYNDLVAVHDAVRPFVSQEAIYKCLHKASGLAGAILGVPVKDTIKKVNTRGVIIETPDRSELWQAQTPQIFSRTILLDAYKNAFNTNMVGTDDASLIEAIGGVIHMVEGSRDNFKLTYPLDFKIAELWIAESKSKQSS